MQPPSKEPEESVKGIWSAYKTLVKIFQRQVSFGHPNHPVDPGYTTPSAGSTDTAHNGLLDNIHGSWVEVEFTSNVIGKVCWHNLDVPVLDINTPNVRWQVFGVFHDRAGAAPQAAPMGVSFHAGAGVVTRNWIVLQLDSPAASRTIDADHPVKVTLFFIPAVRG